jgi:hypothetical protein
MIIAAIAELLGVPADRLEECRAMIVRDVENAKWRIARGRGEQPGAIKKDIGPIRAAAAKLQKLTRKPTLGKVKEDGYGLGRPLFGHALFPDFLDHHVNFRTDRNYEALQACLSASSKVYAADGDHGHNYATTNTVLPPWSTPQQHLNVAMQALGQFGITQGFIGVDLSTPTYSRAVTLVGMARDILSNIANFKQATVSSQQEQVTMVQNGQSMPGGAIVLNSNTGLIGIPTQTSQGILARCLINPSIRVHSQVMINQFDINGGAAAINVAGDNTIGQANLAHVAADGLYMVYKIDVDGETRGNPWYQDLALIATTQVAGQPESPTAAATAAPYLGGQLSGRVRGIATRRTVRPRHGRGTRGDPGGFARRPSSMAAGSGTYHRGLRRQRGATRSRLDHPCWRAFSARPAR